MRAGTKLAVRLKRAAALAKAGQYGMREGEMLASVGEMEETMPDQAGTPPGARLVGHRLLLALIHI